MNDELTTAAEAREEAEFLVSAEGLAYIGPDKETLALARALLAALDENERLREALREIDDMPVDEPARNAWTREFQNIARRALSNETERAKRAEEDFRWADPFEAER